MVIKKCDTGKYIEKLFDRVCDIKRYEFEVKNGVSKPVLKDVYIGAGCRISYTKSESPKETQTASIIKRHVKIFLPIEYKIICGDVFEVRTNDTKEVYKAAEAPRIYSSHQEAEAVLYNVNP